VNYTTIFFDLDETLYPPSSGLWDAIKERIQLYMHERLDIPWKDIPRLRRTYFEQYGTTLRGLEANYAVNQDDYLAYVHNLVLTDYIGPDQELRAVLERLPVRKFVFTNADAAHANRVLHVLQVDDCFDGIVDVHSMQPFCKPQPDAFIQALRIAGEDDPHHCALVDDLPGTTSAARALGFFSILFGPPGSSPDADATLNHWRDLPVLLDGRKL